MKVLVIGAMGHIGSYLVDQLIERKHEVYAITRGNRKPSLRRGFEKNSPKAGKRACFKTNNRHGLFFGTPR